MSGPIDTANLRDDFEVVFGVRVRVMEHGRTNENEISLSWPADGPEPTAEERGLAMMHASLALETAATERYPAVAASVRRSRAWDEPPEDPRESA